MTKKERIAELERKVAALEAINFAALFGSERATPVWRCRCGRTDTHACWITPYDTGSGGTTAVTNLPTYIGAAS